MPQSVPGWRSEGGGIHLGGANPLSAVPRASRFELSHTAQRYAQPLDPGAGEGGQRGRGRGRNTSGAPHALKTSRVTVFS